MGLHEAIAAFPSELSGQQAVGDAFSVRGRAGARCRVDREVRKMLSQSVSDGSVKLACGHVSPPLNRSEFKV